MRTGARADVVARVGGEAGDVARQKAVTFKTLELNISDNEVTNPVTRKALLNAAMRINLELRL